MTEKNTLSANMLSGVRAAESSLAREEMNRMVDALPEGHPLKEEAEKHSSELGGDLSGLPDNHPLIVQLKQAKERYESQVAQESDDAQEQAREIRKAKKLDRARERRERIIHEEEQATVQRDCASAVNEKLDSVLGAVREAYEVLSEHEEKLNKNTLSRARVGRLKRFLYAAERGLSENRMNRA